MQSTMKPPPHETSPAYEKALGAFRTVLEGIEEETVIVDKEWHLAGQREVFRRQQRLLKRIDFIIFVIRQVGWDKHLYPQYIKFDIRSTAWYLGAHASPLRWYERFICSVDPDGPPHRPEKEYVKKVDKLVKALKDINKSDWFALQKALGAEYPNPVLIERRRELWRNMVQPGKKPSEAMLRLCPNPDAEKDAARTK